MKAKIEAAFARRKAKKRWKQEIYATIVRKTKNSGCEEILWEDSTKDENETEKVQLVTIWWQLR